MYRSIAWLRVFLSAAVFFVAPFGAVGCAGNAPLPPKAADLNREGARALSSGDLDLAEARFALALEYHPRFVEALVNLGLVEMQRGNFEQARKLFERAKRVNSDLAQPHHALGVLAERQRRPDLAAECYRDALKVNPGFSPARANLGRILFDAGRYDEAREQFVRLLEIDPDGIEGYVGLAETLLRLGRASESDAVVERGRRKWRDDGELEILQARSQMRKGELAAARARLELLARGGTDTARRALAWLATARLGQGDLEAAIDAARDALASDRDDPVATYVVAEALREKGDPRALPWLERARLLAPGNSVLSADIAAGRPAAPLIRLDAPFP
jgi:tetratricopeptide (TPR) repeat protein